MHVVGGLLSEELTYLEDRRKEVGNNVFFEELEVEFVERLHR